jgi:hypothetical protein
MAWTKSAWADVIASNASKTTVTSNSTVSGDIDCNGTNPFVTLAVKVVAIISNTPQDDVLVQFYGVDTDGANEPDTLAIYEAEIPAVTSSEERATYQLNVSALDNVRVLITNQDDADAISVWASYIGGYA